MDVEPGMFFMFYRLINLPSSISEYFSLLHLAICIIVIRFLFLIIDNKKKVTFIIILDYAHDISDHVLNYNWQSSSEFKFEQRFYLFHLMHGYSAHHSTKLILLILNRWIRTFWFIQFFDIVWSWKGHWKSRSEHKH